MRLLVTDASGRELVREMHITRLAEGVDRTGVLAEPALDRTLAVISGYAQLIRAHDARALRCTATSAARDAENRNVLFERIERELGQPPELLSGEAEAQLSFQGATADQNRDDGPFVSLDIGGGSTEFALGTERVEASVSLDVGCVRLSERFLLDDPPSKSQLAEAAAFVRDLMPRVEARVACRRGRTWLGLAGTVTSLAALDLGLETYDPTRTHGHRLCRRRVESLLEELARAPSAERAERLLEAKRAGVIVGGGLVLQEIMRHFDLPDVVVSERDILDGLAASLRG